MAHRSAISRYKGPTTRIGLASDQEDIAKRFARPAEDKFAGLDWRVSIFGAPLLDRCIAHIECTFEHQHPSGDRDIVIGRVHQVRVYADEPLIFHRSRFGTVIADSATADASRGDAHADPPSADGVTPSRAPG